MIRITHLLLLLLPGAAFAQKAPLRDKPAESRFIDSGYNTTIFYNARMQETREKGATWALLLNLDASGATNGRARLLDARNGAPVWDGGYFLFNRIEPEKSRYQGKCYWYHENGKLGREQEYVKGQREGKGTIYDTAGAKRFEGIWHNDKLTPGMTWYLDGKIGGLAHAQLFDATWDRNWTGEDANGESYVENGLLVIASSSKDGYLKLEPLPIHYGRDFEIESTFSMQGPGVTLYFVAQDSAHFHALDFSGKGMMTFERVAGKERSGSEERFRVPLQKMNTVRISRKGTDLFISVNGSMITSTPFEGGAGNRFGFSLPGRGSQVRVASIVARQMGRLPEPERPAESPKKESAPAKGAPKTTKRG